MRRVQRAWIRKRGESVTMTSGKQKVDKERSSLFVNKSKSVESIGL